METSWVSRHLCRAPVPTWARHQCPVGEGKGGAPAKPETPSLNPVGPLCPPSRLPPGLVMPPSRLPPVPISGVRVRERRRRREAGSRGGDGEQGELWGPAGGSLTGGRGGSGRGNETAAAPRTRSRIYTGISCAFFFALCPFLELIFWKIKKQRQTERKRGGRGEERKQ